MAVWLERRPPKEREGQKDSADPSSPPDKKPNVSPSAPPAKEKAKTAPPPTKPATGAAPTPAKTAALTPAAPPPPLALAPPAMPTVTPAPGKAGLESPRPAAVLVEKLLLETGFDLETGQILDAAKFAKWKQQKARQEAASAVSNASLFEIFRKARTAIENWVDDDLNREAVIHSSLKQIEKRADVGLILGKYENYGPAMREKLLQHLDFMVDNRKKYHTACSK